MSDPRNFLSRWSRRKLDGAEAVADAKQLPPASIEEGTDDPAAPAQTIPAFDPESLPSIDSIHAGSDIRAFLQRGVPADLSRAALRRAWTADPAIRDFIGLSENAWDFNAPDSIPGFGSIGPDDIRRLAAQLFGESGSLEQPVRPSPDRNPLVQSASTQGESVDVPMHEMRKPEPVTPRSNQVADSHKLEEDRPKTASEERKADVAVQHIEEKPEYDSEYDAPSSRQRHGGALPE
ncbi:MAG: hypothetical protein QOF19_3056 [Alphaproteobacteria bacterium]|jgi:hypothetical protein|nr:hypothetical protein [Alphaproteobacteria bacterium]